MPRSYRLLLCALLAITAGLIALRHDENVHASQQPIGLWLPWEAGTAWRVTRNVPQTLVFDQVADVFQTAVELSFRYTLPLFASYEATGDIAEPFATSVLLIAASTST